MMLLTATAAATLAILNATEITAFETATYTRVDPPQKIVAIDRGIRASAAFSSTDEKDFVAVPPGTVMGVVMRDKTSAANCIVLPDTVTKGLRARSPSGCFWTGVQ